MEDNDAESLPYRSLRNFQHQFAWKVLGVVLSQQEESLKLQALSRRQLHYLLKTLKPIATWAPHSNN